MQVRILSAGTIMRKEFTAHCGATAFVCRTVKWCEGNFDERESVASTRPYLQILAFFGCRTTHT